MTYSVCCDWPLLLLPCRLLSLVYDEKRMTKRYDLWYSFVRYSRDRGTRDVQYNFQWRND